MTFFRIIGRGTLVRTRNADINLEQLTDRDKREEYSASFGLVKNGAYIENQSKWSAIRFGRGLRSNMAYSGCEIIACYNALIALMGRQVGTPGTLIELIHYFERHGAALLGDFGTDPGAIAKFLRERGFWADMVVTDDAKQLDELIDSYKLFIMTLFNDELAVSGKVHTMTVTKEGSGLQLHNCGGKCLGPAESITELLELYHVESCKKALPICTIFVK